MLRSTLASTRLAAASGLVLAVSALLGCTPTDGEGDTAGANDYALSTTNGLTMINGLTMTNGLSAANGLTMINGLSTTTGLSSSKGLMTTAAGRDTVAYLVRCALPAGDSLVKKDQNGTAYTFPGKIGVAPQWKSGACDTNCQENVSACLMAHVNTTGKHVALWLDGTSPAIGWGRDPSYPMQESAFFGNIFTTGAPRAFYCDGHDWDRAPVAGRIGATQTGSPYTNPFGATALCAGHCTTAGYTGQEYGSCNGYKNVVTVYRDFDPTTNFNICNKSNGLCFGVADQSLSSGAVIHQETRNGLDSQKFLIERLTADSDAGKYRLRAKRSGLYLTVIAGSTYDGAWLSQTSWTGGAEQQWWLQKREDSSYTLVNVKSNRMVDSNNTSINTPVIQNGSGSGYATHQLWRILTAQ